MNGSSQTRRRALGLLAGGLAAATAVPALSITTEASPELVALFTDFTVKWEAWEAMDHDQWEVEAGPYYDDVI